MIKILLALFELIFMIILIVIIFPFFVFLYFTYNLLSNKGDISNGYKKKTTNL